ncbi:MAG: hypothetical protein JSV56_03180 [Methanomassiliicoccales archaeon]|nr:MAG: hypothetical protein JSV56_03180 [Methanomassiliicoccales archaeon]
MLCVGYRFWPVFSVFIIILILFNSHTHTLDVKGEGSGDYPPPVNGDWIIRDTTRVSNETIFLEGLLNVTNNAFLTLDNVTLIFNISSVFNPRIYVDWGAELLVLNSNITSTQTLYSFEANGNLTIDNSILSRIDNGIRLNLGNYTISNSTLFNNPQYAVMCMGDIALYYNESLAKVVLYNNTIHSNYCALAVSYFHEPYLCNNNIFNNDWGIICQVYGSLVMYGNHISHNTMGGIKGELGYFWLENNTIASNGGYGVKGDHTTIYANNNTIFDNELWGIYAFNAPIIHDNNTFSMDGSSESQGGLLQEWEVLVNVKNVANKTLRGVNLTLYDSLGNMIWTAETIGSVRRVVLKEYEILNEGTEINHMPFAINATKGDYFYNNTYEVDPYEEIIIILEYEEEQEPEENPAKRVVPSWIIAMLSIIWLLAFIFVILGASVNYFRNRKP